MQEAETVRKIADFPDIRLSWVQRFCSAARHGSLVQAGKECCVSSSEVSESVQALGSALCLPLLIPTTAKRFVLGRAFSKTSERILAIAKLIPDNQLNAVRVCTLQSLIAVAKCGGYSCAAKATGRSRYGVMRDIKTLATCLGRPIVYVGDEVRLTADGQALERAAREIVSLLERSIGRDRDPKRWVKKPRKLPAFLKHLR